MSTQQSQTTPAGATSERNQLRIFLQSLPQEAKVLGAKLCQSTKKKSFFVAYSHNGKLHHAYCRFTIGKLTHVRIETLSTATEGGAL